MRLPSLKFKASLLILFATSPLWAKQDQLYPTAAATQIRWDSYLDDIFTVDKSSWSVIPGTWTYLVNKSTPIWLGPSYVNVRIDSATVHVAISTEPVNTWTWDYLTSTATYSPMSIQDYTDMVIKQTQLQDILTITKNMTEYMVFTEDGWCMEVINGHNVPVKCP